MYMVINVAKTILFRYYSDCAEKRAAPQARKEEDAKKLWEISEKLVGLKSE